MSTDACSTSINCTDTNKSELLSQQSSISSVTSSEELYREKSVHCTVPMLPILPIQKTVITDFNHPIVEDTTSSFISQSSTSNQLHTSSSANDSTVQYQGTDQSKVASLVNVKSVADECKKAEEQCNPSCTNDSSHDRFFDGNLLTGMMSADPCRNSNSSVTSRNRGSPSEVEPLSVYNSQMASMSNSVLKKSKETRCISPSDGTIGSSSNADPSNDSDSDFEIRPCPARRSAKSKMHGSTRQTMSKSKRSKCDHTRVNNAQNNISVRSNHVNPVSAQSHMASGDHCLAARLTNDGTAPTQPSQSRKRAIKEEPFDSDDASITVKERKIKRERISVKDESNSVKQQRIKREPKVEIKVEPGSVKSRKLKKESEPVEIWRWWEEKKYDDGRKWTTLSHNGPVFADPYIRLPSSVKFYYNGEHVVLSKDAEEAMTFYAKMLTHDYTKKDLFNKNFMHDWRSFMTKEEKLLISNLNKCNFSEVNAYFERKSEERKNMSKEEKKAIKDANEEVRKKFGFCFWDHHKQPVGNYKIEPPGLFRGRGEHPKQGCIKRRIQPEDVIINCDKNVKAPEPPEGHKWKEVRHDNKVSWLATWTENIMGNNKYIMLNPSARVKAERDWQKYEKARKLHRVIGKIRDQYRTEWKDREMRIRQRAVALYFIDQLALRVGNEKDEDEADTVGCCSLRYEHIKLHEHLPDFGENVVEFDFLGKDSIRYHNFVPVDVRVYKNLRRFLENKTDGDELFDRVTTTSLNQFLTDLMDGLSAKVFRTYNASKTLQDQLDELTNRADAEAAKLLSYNRANRQVAILCNHQRSIPKTFDTSMEKLKAKIDAKRDQLQTLKKECKNLEIDFKNTKKIQTKKDLDKKKNMLTKAKEQLVKLKIQATDKEENKQIALGTSKLNYLDPRISVAWCKKHSVPIEKIYSKTQRDKFMWALHMADENFHFYNYKGEIEIKPEATSDSNSAVERGEDDEYDEEES